MKEYSIISKFSFHIALNFVPSRLQFPRIQILLLTFSFLAIPQVGFNSSLPLRDPVLHKNGWQDRRETY